MANVLLIHGSGHGAWCWRDVLPLLAAAGHQARAIDLPGHGIDPTPRGQVSLDDYARAVLAALPSDGQSVVVGHSMAGYPISRAADLAPERFAKLVYLCAYVPAPGKSLADMRRAWPEQPLLPAIRTASDGLTFSFDPQMVEACFYHDCPAGTLAYAQDRLTPQPVAPQATPLTLGAGYASVARHYIRCLDDRAIPPDYQARMAEGFAPGHVTSLPTSHSPFFAAPQALADRIDTIARLP